MSANVYVFANSVLPLSCPLCKGASFVDTDAWALLSSPLMIGTVEIRTRPLRLAYLVEPNNVSQIRQAIRLSSSLWGGGYAPIIPLYKTIPRKWVDRPFRRPPAKEVTLGYLDAFDPDVLIQIVDESPDFIRAKRLEIAKAAAIWEVLNTPRPTAPKFGIALVWSADTNS